MSADASIIHAEDGLCIEFFPADADRSRRLVYVFSPLNNTRLAGNAYGGALLQRSGYDVIAFKTTRDDWFQSVPEGVFARISEFAARRGYLSRMSYGYSMGGYAAIAFSARLDCDMAVAFSPQFSVDEDYDRRWAARAHGIRWVYRVTPASIRAGCRYRVLYDDRSQDAQHADRFAQLIPAANLDLIRMPFTGHSSAHSLAEAGLIKQVALSLLEGVDVAKLDLRSNRKESGAYLYNLSLELMRRGKPRMALATIERAVELAPSIPRFRVQRAAVLEALGQPDRTPEAVRQADADARPVPSSTGPIAVVSETSPVVPAGSARRYTLGYDERSDLALIPGADGLVMINCHRLLRFDEEDLTRTLNLQVTEIGHVMRPQDTVVTSVEVLNSQVRAALARGRHFSAQEYDCLRLCIARFLRRVGTLNLNKQVYWPAEATFASLHPDSRWGRKFYARYGNVELRVVEAFLRDPDALIRQLSEVAARMGDEAFMYAAAQRSHWLDVADQSYNLRTLMTNAGFYVACAKDEASLTAWCSAYLEALKSADALFQHAAVYPNFLVVQDALARRGPLVPHMTFPPPAVFYRSLAGEDVVFVTPFAQEIRASVQDGRLYRLYKDIEVPPFSLRTCEAPISTYPNRPGTSWRESFESMKSAVDQLFEERRPSVFIAACGCYGLPLTHYVHRTYGCTALYFGNRANTLFGIRQKTSAQFVLEHGVPENWTDSRLAEFPNMERIDHGRYVV